jgi:hypothetical protein
MRQSTPAAPGEVFQRIRVPFAPRTVTLRRIWTVLDDEDEPT